MKTTIGTLMSQQEIGLSDLIELELSTLDISDKTFVHLYVIQNNLPINASSIKEAMMSKKALARS